ncbi:MAG TPA: hypothetical protein VLC09_12760, partial [Polyangiaceae bacterium]|nr:hypothetical protein [Polyangiaceae bacterium]
MTGGSGSRAASRAANGGGGGGTGGPGPGAPNEIPVDEGDVRDVGLLVRSHHPLLFVVEQEAGRVLSLLERVGAALDMPVFTWKAHRGLVRHGGDGHAVYKTEPIAQCLAHVASANAEVITYLYDFEGQLDSPEIQARLHELHDQLSKHRGALVISGSIEDLPPRLSRFFTPVKLSRVSIEAYYGYVARVVDELRQRIPVRVQLTSAELTELLEHLRGLSFDEVRKVITQALVDNGRLDRDDIEGVLEAKKRAVERAGVLEY